MWWEYEKNCKVGYGNLWNVIKGYVINGKLRCGKVIWGKLEIIKY